MTASWAWTILIAFNEGLALVAIYFILRRPRDPRGMMAWVLALLLLPGVGLIFFLFYGLPRKGLLRIRRRRRRLRLAPSLARRAELAQKVRVPDPQEPGLRTLMGVSKRLKLPPAVGGNDVSVYHDSEQTFLALQLAIESAESHVHLEYYIFQPDETGRAVRDLLIKKARQGVECRLLLDYVGCWKLSRSFVRPMREAGVRVAFALPVLPWRGRWRVNYRNHRKIAVVDGKIGLTGSQNIGDEYRSRLKKTKAWRDTHLKVVGPAAQQLQEIFAEDWHYTTREDLVADRYFPPVEAAGPHTVQIVASGPDLALNVMHQLLLAAVSAAQTSICVITPYFVPDQPMVMAFQSAAYRGVKVQLVIPSCTDHHIVLWAGRSFYEELVDAGVEIYEQPTRMLHSKSMTIDGLWAMVGSANMDERSFRINFEVTTLLYSAELAAVLQEDFDALRGQSYRITTDDILKRSFGETMLLGVTRLASPIL